MICRRAAAASRKANADDRKELIRAIRACNGLIAGPRGAAALLGLNRSTLNSRLKKLGLDVKRIMEDS